MRRFVTLPRLKLDVTQYVVHVINPLLVFIGLVSFPPYLYMFFREEKNKRN